jgi:hypothetical protein
MVTLLHHPHESCDSKALFIHLFWPVIPQQRIWMNSRQTFSRIPPDLAFRTPWNGWEYSPLHHGITRFIWWKNNFFELPTKQTYQSVSGPMPFSSESSCKHSNDGFFFSAFPGTGAYPFNQEPNKGFKVCGFWRAAQRWDASVGLLVWTRVLVASQWEVNMPEKGRRMSRVRWRWWKEVSKMMQSRTNAGVDMHVLWCCTATSSIV